MGTIAYYMREIFFKLTTACEIVLC